MEEYIYCEADFRDAIEDVNKKTINLGYDFLESFIKDNPDVLTCPACGTDNIFKDSDGWVYCNCCGEVWEEKEL